MQFASGKLDSVDICFWVFELKEKGSVCAVLFICRWWVALRLGVVNV